MPEELKSDQPESPQSDGLKKVGGKWYLTFNWLNTFEPRGGEWQHEEVELKATNEEEAIAEAEAMKKSGARAQGDTGPEIPENYEVIYKTGKVRSAIDKTLEGADR